MSSEQSANVLNKQQHKLFWVFSNFSHSSSRYNKFQKLLVEMKAKREENQIVKGLAPLLLAYMKQIDTSAPLVNVATINRFINTGDEKLVFGNNPYNLSLLCRAAFLYCEESTDTLCPDSSNLLKKLANEANALPSYDQSKERKSYLLSGTDAATTYEVGNLKKILKFIPDRTEKGIARAPVPIFPYGNPKWPATPLKEHTVKGKKVFIKDESHNITGSHKDRWALEKLIWYKQQLLPIIASMSDFEDVVVPQMSLISSGSAAIALQTLLGYLGLPPLNVVIDKRRINNQELFDYLEVIGAVLFDQNLETKLLSESDVLGITQSKIKDEKWDITTREVVESHDQNFYDWLVVDVLRKRPNHIFVPFGTGGLFSSFICFIEEQHKPGPADPRLKGVDITDLKINVYGATTKNPSTCMDKLYAQKLPSKTSIDKKLAVLQVGTDEKDDNEDEKDDNEIVVKNILGENSGIYILDEESAHLAFDTIKYEVKCEHSGIAGLGLFLRDYDEFGIKESDTTVIVNTGWLHIPNHN